ncbi:ABC transporter permease [Spirosoma endophyticum]|uniref:ABC-type antimicrobial peptide transport system, permease component n=1 Tax=Spirosoma endophyticum TaxID=662367 RepID=A0A1I1Z9N1_9BACT|nr:ABC transporter permease [Spirosoma endophyticum]SFE28399.1 ABC-type antimicrobial peptide transport system, permease component [Spirosoma endophyticum]
MLRNYLKIAWRNLLRNKVYSFINIGGLAVGMAVAMLIGLWVWDELSFDKSFANYDRIAQVMQHQTYNKEIGTQRPIPFPLGAELRRSYGDNFKHVLMASWVTPRVLTVGNKHLSKSGISIEAQAPDMLTLNMRKGTRAGLTDPASILLSESVAHDLFGETDPMNKLIRLDNKTTVKVTGVYENLHHNSSFSNLSFITPWALYLSEQTWIREMENPWRSNSFQLFVQLAEQADMDKVSAKIKNVKLKNIRPEERRYQPQVFLNPMRQWHLYSEFKDGVRTGGLIQFVWLFGSIGVFVLLLACINFMNLSTARSEKRAKEVGIRKAVGSLRGQLITQFFGESLLVVALAFGLALAVVFLTLPTFNQVAEKQIHLPLTNPLFWLLGLGISLLTGLIAGSYPALYLSAFKPLSVLKGTFRVGRFAAVPRRVLVVMQFTVSITLIVGTIIVFRQIQFAKNRPVGYSRAGLMTLMGTENTHKHIDAIRTELKAAGVVAELAESGSPTTDVWNTNGGFEWRGKDPGLSVDFPNTEVSYEFGKTIGWQLVAGRDFSRSYGTDSTSFIINEAAAKFMGFTNPIGEVVRWDGQPFTIIGVVKDIVVQSPYQPIPPSVYHLAPDNGNVVTIRINPAVSTSQALAGIETVIKKYNPAIPFDYRFTDQEYAKKFGDEERIGTLASIFAVLAIFISCLGLFGLASFMAEQRTKEIGMRKVLGASVLNLWGLLSKDFVVLVVIALFIATPMAYYFLNGWLQQYEYRTDIAWWIFALSGAGALVITLLTVSFQSVKAALMNPVKSLRSE